jgi:hypothetical protein
MRAASAGIPLSMKAGVVAVVASVELLVDVMNDVISVVVVRAEPLDSAVELLRAEVRLDTAVAVDAAAVGVEPDSEVGDDVTLVGGT